MKGHNDDENHTLLSLLQFLLHPFEGDLTVSSHLHIYVTYLVMCYRCIFFVFVTAPIMLFNGFRLLLFVLCLLPGFVQFAWYYFVVAQRRSIAYGNDSRRQYLDIYDAVPSSSTHDGDPPLLKRPVVVFCPGGAWLIGYKMWGALTARALTACGMIVVVPDYRNYPWSTVPGMVDDVSTALQWTRDYVDEYGGDGSNIVVVGQSAGGHLIFTALLRQAMELGRRAPAEDTAAVLADGTDPANSLETTSVPSSGNTFLTEPAPPAASEDPIASWKASDFKGLITLSAPFDLKAMSVSFRKHGLDKNIVDRIFGSDSQEYDPKALLDVYMAMNDAVGAREMTPLGLPPIRVYHGDADKTVPECDEFVTLLRRCASHLQTTTYAGWSHTDAIIEGPMMANHTFHRDVFDAVREWTQCHALEWPDDHHPSLRPICPSCLVQMGRFCMPF